MRQRILQALADSDLIELDGQACSLLEGGDDDGEDLCFGWTDEEGRDFEVRIPLAHLDQASSSDDGFVVLDAEDQPALLCPYRLIKQPLWR